MLCIALFISTLAQMAFVLLLSVSNNRYKQNARLKEEYLNLQKEHYQYLEAKNMETRKFRHDMRSHMLIIKEQIKLEKWEALDKYIDTICEKLEYVPGYISVQNEIVDAILNYYNMQFKENQVVFKVSGKMPKDCFIEAYDLCAIFANILSNALEASVKTNEKRVFKFRKVTSA